MKKYLLILMMAIAVAGCEKDDFGEVVPAGDFLFSQQGVFIINEGNFSHNNGSLSFYSFDSAKVYPHIFLNTNKRPPGDIPNYMALRDTTGLIVINNASRIEFVNSRTFNSRGSLQVGTSPREVLIAGDNKAYVSDLYSDSLAVIDLEGRRVSHKIGLGRTSESMVLAGDKLFAANWSMYAHPGKENNRVMVVDVLTDRVVDSVLVTKEPNSMVAGKNGFVWILSSGGYDNEETPALTKVDPHSRRVVKTFPFAAAQSNPVALSANAAADTLFWLNNGMYAMDISDEKLPEAPAIPQNGHIYYSLAITQQRILLSDAVDYQQRGVIYVYDKQYRLDTTFRAGIIPGFMLPVKP